MGGGRRRNLDSREGMSNEALNAVAGGGGRGNNDLSWGAEGGMRTSRRCRAVDGSCPRKDGSGEMRDVLLASSSVGSALEQLASTLVPSKPPPTPSNSCSSSSSTSSSLNRLVPVMTLAMDPVRFRPNRDLREAPLKELRDDAEDIRATRRSSMA